MIQKEQYKSNGTKLSYYKIGHGPKVILAFPGYGQDGTAFLCYSNDIESRYTLYSFDIFNFGDSQWHDKDEPITFNQWEILIKSFLKDKNIEAFTLIGYSLGNKLLLATLQLLPTRIEKIIMLAPDGIKKNFWYSLSTRTPWMRRYLKNLIIHPEGYYTLIKLLSKIGFVHKSVGKFSLTQMNTFSKRWRVYYTWTQFRKLKYRVSEIRKLITTHKIPCFLILGKHDRIIRKKDLKGLIKHHKYIHLYEIESGHTDLINKSESTIFEKNIL